MVLGARQYYTLLLLFVFIYQTETTTQTSSSNKHDEDKDNSSWKWNQYILTIVTSLSGLGSIIIIVTYFLWTDLQTTSRKFLVYISIGDFFTVFPTLVIYWDGSYKSNNEHSAFYTPCKFQSFVTSTAVMWSFFWTSSLAIYLYIALVKKHYNIAEKSMVIFHIINWTVPVVLLASAWKLDVLGSSDEMSTKGWCWIQWNTSDHKSSTIWMFFCGKLWEIISYFINAIFFFLVTRDIKQQVSQSFHLMSTQSIQIAEHGMKKLIFVPVIFVVLRIWGTIRFFLLITSADVPTYVDEVLGTLQIIGDQSQGIANFILFCALTEKFKKGLARICKYNNADRAPLLANKRPQYKDGRTFSDTNIYNA